MNLIISGTNRPGSNTLKVAKQYQQLFEEKGATTALLSLQKIQSIEKEESFLAIEEEFLVPAQKILIISPEYNGSFPGILKLMIDLSDIKTVFYGKKIALTGVANGRAGNLRGLDNLTNIFNYLKVQVMPNKLPISGVMHLLDPATDQIKDPATILAMQTQIEEFINF